MDNDSFAVATSDLTIDFETVRAVDHLSLQVPRGIVFGFLGPNGSGKTTTIRTLLGLLEPTQGQARVLGFDSQKQADSIREHSGALLEHNGLYERLTAEDNLEFFGRIYHLSKSERKARIKELLTHIGLWERRTEQVKNWSKGMRQKLAVARALIHRPQLVFLDEPTSGLDPVAAVALRNDLASLVENEGITIFLNTHNLTEAEKLCSQVGVIHNGKLLNIGKPAELQEKMSNPKITIKGNNFSESLVSMLMAQPEISNVQHLNGSLTIDLIQHTEIAPLITLIVNNGAEIEDIQRHTASLEDVFLKLVNEEKEK